MDKKLAISALVGIALVSKNVGDACIPSIGRDHNFYFSQPKNVDLFCQINSYNPEHPETKNTQVGFPTPSADYMTASGIGSPLASISPTDRL